MNYQKQDDVKPEPTLRGQGMQVGCAAVSVLAKLGREYLEARREHAMGVDFPLVMAVSSAELYLRMQREGKQ